MKIVSRVRWLLGAYASRAKGDHCVQYTLITVCYDSKVRWATVQYSWLAWTKIRSPYSTGTFIGTGVTKEDKSARGSVMAHFME